MVSQSQHGHKACLLLLLLQEALNGFPSFELVYACKHTTEMQAEQETSRVLLISGGRSLHSRRESRSGRGVSRCGMSKSRSGGADLGTSVLET